MSRTVYPVNTSLRGGVVECWSNGVARFCRYGRIFLPAYPGTFLWLTALLLHYSIAPVLHDPITLDLGSAIGARSATLASAWRLRPIHSIKISTRSLAAMSRVTSASKPWNGPWVIWTFCPGSNP